MNLNLLENLLGTVYYYKLTNVCLAKIPYVHIYMGRYLGECLYKGRKGGRFQYHALGWILFSFELSCMTMIFPFCSSFTC